MGQPCRTGSRVHTGYCPAWSLQPRMVFACAIRLTASSGNCTLSSRGLYVGTYRLWAFYTGSAIYKSSSTSRILVVLRNPYDLTRSKLLNERAGLGQPSLLRRRRRAGRERAIVADAALLMPPGAFGELSSVARPLSVRAP